MRLLLSFFSPFDTRAFLVRDMVTHVCSGVPFYEEERKRTNEKTGKEK
jgi:hypothetical protein